MRGLGGSYARGEPISIESKSKKHGDEVLTSVGGGSP